MRPSRAHGLAAAAGVSLLCLAAAAQAASEGLSATEQKLTTAIEQMQGGLPKDALKNLESLTRQEPNFRLGQLIYGELLAALSNDAPGSAPDTAELQSLAEEARVRLASEKAVPPKGSVPDSVLQLAPLYKNLLLVDLPRARLYVLENKDGQLVLARHQYIGIGKNGYGKQKKGDQRTPVGVYHVTGWKGDAELPELYGSGAFPLSYPNPWDTFKKRDGTGIWLHGVPRSVYNRPPRSSEGCVTMANDDLLALKPYIALGHTPVVLSDAVQWLPPDMVRADREAWTTRIETWRKDWASRDTDTYLSHYGSEFSTEGMGFNAFGAHKRRVNAGKKFIQIELRDLSLYRYPAAGEPLVLAEFTLDYKSDNYATVSRKQQFWRQEKDGSWKIFREENR